MGDTAESTATPRAVSVGRGIGLVGVAIIISGLLVNGYLAVVARNISAADYKNFGAYWSLALVIGFGVFLPVEQELARLLHTPGGHRGVLRSAMITAAAFGGLELLVVLAAAPLLMPALGGKGGLLACLGALCLVSAGQFVVRGFLIGTVRMGRYGAILVIDTTLRLLFAVLLAVTITTDSAGYGWTLVAAIAIAHLTLLPLLYRGTAPGEPTSTTPRTFAAAVAPLLLGSLAAQVLLNGVPVLVSAVATQPEQAEAGTFQAAFLLARIPLFVAVPLQTAIVPILTRMFSSGRPHAAIQVITRFALAMLAMAVLGAGACFAFGPWLVELIFGSQYQVQATDLALMVAGVSAHLGLIIATQALVASAMHAKVAWSWLAGVAVAAVVFALVPGLALRGELAFLTGSLVGWVVALMLLVRKHGTKENSVPS
jgi:O-antigen/teichoic acid export membrane protein